MLFKLTSKKAIITNSLDSKFHQKSACQGSVSPQTQGQRLAKGYKKNGNDPFLLSIIFLQICTMLCLERLKLGTTANTSQKFTRLHKQEDNRLEHTARISSMVSLILCYISTVFQKRWVRSEKESSHALKIMPQELSVLDETFSEWQKQQYCRFLNVSFIIFCCLVMWFKTIVQRVTLLPQGSPDGNFN